MKLNYMQKVVLRDYGDGDYAYLIDEGEIQDHRTLGDSLLSFMLVELSNDEDCQDIDEGLNRLLRGHKDLTVAMQALAALKEEILHRTADLARLT